MELMGDFASFFILLLLFYYLWVGNIFIRFKNLYKTILKKYIEKCLIPVSGPIYTIPQPPITT